MTYQRSLLLALVLGLAVTASAQSSTPNCFMTQDNRGPLGTDITSINEHSRRNLAKDYSKMLIEKGLPVMVEANGGYGERLVFVGAAAASKVMENTLIKREGRLKSMCDFGYASVSFVPFKCKGDKCNVDDTHPEAFWAYRVTKMGWDNATRKLIAGGDIE